MRILGRVPHSVAPRIITVGIQIREAIRRPTPRRRRRRRRYRSCEWVRGEQRDDSNLGGPPARPPEFV